MVEFVMMIGEVLLMPFSIGGVTVNLGEIAGGYLIFRFVIERLWNDFTEHRAGEQWLDDRARQHGFESYEKEQSYHAWMGGDGPGKY